MWADPRIFLSSLIPSDCRENCHIFWGLGGGATSFPHPALSSLLVVNLCAALACLTVWCGRICRMKVQFRSGDRRGGRKDLRWMCGRDERSSSLSSYHGKISCVLSPTHRRCRCSAYNFKQWLWNEFESGEGHPSATFFGRAPPLFWL